MKIKATKDLHNKGKCFTKGKIYKVVETSTEAGLMEKMTTNDLGEKHLIGSWWRYFKIVK